MAKLLSYKIDLNTFLKIRSLIVDGNVQPTTTEHVQPEQTSRGISNLNSSQISNPPSGYDELLSLAQQLNAQSSVLHPPLIANSLQAVLNTATAPNYNVPSFSFSTQSAFHPVNASASNQQPIAAQNPTFYKTVQQIPHSFNSSNLLPSTASDIEFSGIWCNPNNQLVQNLNFNHFPAQQTAHQNSDSFQHPEPLAGPSNVSCQSRDPQNDESISTQNSPPPFSCQPSASKAVEEIEIDVVKDSRAPSTSERSLPTNPYFPTHFLRGTVLQLRNNSRKMVENLHARDFLEVAKMAANHSMKMRIGKVVDLKASSINHSLLATFKIEEELESGDIMVYSTDIRASIEYPFFELRKGWSSKCPTKTQNLFGLECSMLEIGDYCILLTEYENENEHQLLNPIAESSQTQQVTSSPAKETEVKDDGYFKQKDVEMDDHVEI
ncbi:Ataxin-1 and HBP1 module (AXH) domain containing protein [Aphelenchoides besseyi]|nr:Ataxin-1 and HBP1 module (AXH) domain containing protein [Aphelenchoides besseyi]